MTDTSRPGASATPLWKAVVIAIFSAAWLGPLLGAASEARAWAERDLAYRVAGRLPLDSAPHLDLALTLLEVSFGWLTAVIFFWTVHFMRRGTTSKDPESS